MGGGGNFGLPLLQLTVAGKPLKERKEKGKCELEIGVRSVTISKHKREREKKREKILRGIVRERLVVVVVVGRI